MKFTSYAQNFEDVMLWRALKHIEKGFYIDVGAWSPDLDSVTRAFYEHGWSGINIEPNPVFNEQLSSRRIRDTNLKVAISDRFGIQKMNFLGNPGLSTLDDVIAKKHSASGWDLNRIEVQVTTLALVWTEHVPPGQDVHFLKIDVEGYEEAALHGMDWNKCRPWVVVVEATLPMSQEESHGAWEHILLAAGYQPAYCDGLNRYYVAQEQLELLPAFKYPPNVFDDFQLAIQVEADAKVQQAQAEARQAQAEARQAQAEADQQKAALQAIYKSKSWRVTAPLRWLSYWVSTPLRRSMDTRPDLKPRLVLDMYVLGQGVKTGVYRVCDELFRRLAKRSDFDVHYLLRPGTRAASLDYLKVHGMRQSVLREDASTSVRACDILLSPFGVAPGCWLKDQNILHAHIVYDLIAVRRPELFTSEASSEVRQIMDSLTPNTLVFAISEFTRQDLLDYRSDLSPEQVLVIPLAAGEQFTPCMDLDLISAAKMHYSIPIDAPYILSLATLEVRKNLNSVVDAFVLYLNSNPGSDLHLVLAGMSGWKLESFSESLLKAGCWRDRIILTGFVEDRDLSAIYSGAICFIYLSLYEGFGLPPLEAMACGTPVICSNNSSLPEVVGDAGILIDANDIQAGAQSIAQVCNSAQLRSDLARRGLARSKIFSWERCEDLVAESLKQFAMSKIADMGLAPISFGAISNAKSLYSDDSSNSCDDARSASGVRCATYFGYRDGDCGPAFPVYLNRSHSEHETWPIWTNSLTGAERCSEEGGLRTLGQLKSGTADSPLITYITVVRNNQETLERTILSVQAQTYGNVEHIVLDGASCDGTLGIIKRHADKIDYYASEPDAGLYDALNKAIPLSRGQLICVLNSDDWLEPNAAEIAAQHVTEFGDPVMLLTAARVSDGKLIHDWRPALVHPGSYFMCANDCHNAIYASKKTYELTGPYDSTYKIAADFKWIMSAMDAGCKFIYSTESTVNYSLGGTSADFLGHSRECMRVVQDRFPALSQEEVRGLYHCFFIFSHHDEKFTLDIPHNYTTFLRKTQAKHADDQAFIASMGWASIVKLSHPRDVHSLMDSQETQRLKYKIANRLKRFPSIYSFARNLYQRISGTR